MNMLWKVTVQKLFHCIPRCSYRWLFYLQLKQFRTINTNYLNEINISPSSMIFKEHLKGDWPNPKEIFLLNKYLLKMHQGIEDTAVGGGGWEGDTVKISGLKKFAYYLVVNKLEVMVGIR